MGTSMEVVVSELDSAAARLADVGQSLQDGLSAVDLSVDTLLGSGWKGGAASAYTTEWNTWHNGAAQVIGALQSMSESLKAAGAHYAATDQQAAAAVGSSVQPTGGSSGGGGPDSPGAGAPSAGAPSAPGTATGQPGADPMAETMNLGQPAAQAAQAIGQLAAGLAQAVAGIAQGVTGIVQAGQGQPAEHASAASKEDDAAEDDERGDGATASPTGGVAPVDTVPGPSPTVSRTSDAR